jgi:methionine-rich copper-binding protein CopC
MVRPGFGSAIAALVLGCVTGCAPSLAVPPRLVAAWPADGATVSIAAHTVELTFNRPLSAEGTWAVVSPDGDDGNPLDTRTAVDPSDARRLTVELLSATDGAYRLHWHVVSARSDASDEGQLRFNLAKGEGMPRLEVSSPTVENGERIWITGHGFKPSSLVRLTMGDDEQELMTVPTDPRGGFDKQVHVPAGVAFGEQRIAGVDSSGNTAAAAVLVNWGGWPPLVGFTIGQPGPERDEVSFSISLRNRSDYVLERVRVVLDDPGGATFVAAEPSTVHGAGAVAWDLPLLDRGVAGPFVATYRATRPTTSHARIEFRHRRPRGCTAEDCLSAFVSETSSDSTPVSPAG